LNSAEPAAAPSLKPEKQEKSLDETSADAKTAVPNRKSYSLSQYENHRLFNQVSVQY